MTFVEIWNSLSPTNRSAIIAFIIAFICAFALIGGITITVILMLNANFIAAALTIAFSIASFIGSIVWAGNTYKWWYV